MPLPKTIADHFNVQAAASETLGSPFTAALCRLLAERLEPSDSAFGKRIAGWPGDARDDALSLRAAGGLNALARSGRCPPLTAVYPPNALDPNALWTGVLAAIAQEDAFLTAYLDSPPQTNEVSRSSAILGGCLTIAAETGMPLEIVEIGASTGLNLSFDRYRYDLGNRRQWGDRASDVRISSLWEGDRVPDLTAPLSVVARAGCDRNPIDAADPAGRERLLSYIWPDQTARVARIAAALEATAAAGIVVDRADADDWLPERLAAPQTEGRVRVVLHTIMWQYMPLETRERIAAAIAEAGARATAEAPLARLEMENDETPGSAVLRLTLWPSGQTRILGRADFHGRWVRWADAG